MRHRPCSLRRGIRRSSFRVPRNMRERIAARRYEISPRLSAQRVSCETRAHLAAHRRGDFAPWDRASGRGLLQAFAHVRPHRVQPSKAAPRSWSGRLPKASRTEGYEPSRAGAASCPARMTSHENALIADRTVRTINARERAGISSPRAWRSHFCECECSRKQ